MIKGKLTFHCFFEQSGTFKNVFKLHGHNAYDYDICNDYNETDYKIDLFKEIENAYDKITDANLIQSTVFDNFEPGRDFIIAFFPCTYFTSLNELIFKRFANTDNSDLPGIEKVIKRNNDRAYYFDVFIKFCYVCQKLGIQTIIENPASLTGYTQFLELFSPYRVSYREKDRTLFGDKFIKPTNFFAINFEMKEKFMMFDQEVNYKVITYRKRKNKSIIVEGNQRKRSEITTRYADNFYKRFLENAIKDKKC